MPNLMRTMIGATALALMSLSPAALAASHGGSHSGGGHGGVSRGGFHSSGGHAGVAPRGPRSGGGADHGYRGGYHGGGHHGGGYHGGGRYWGGYWGPYWSSWWWWGSPYWGWGPSGYIYSDGRARRYAQSRYGVVDTGVSPEEAEVWLDGKYIGTADDFDGYPDYLYLRSGKYHVEFRLKGYETYASDIEIGRGEKIGFKQELKLQPGQSKLQDFPPSKGMPSGRFFRQGAEPDVPNAPAVRDRRQDRHAEDDFDVRRDRVGRYEGEDEEDEDAPKKTPSRESRSDKATLRLKVTPEDAAVYVDDRYVGTGAEVGRTREGFRTEPGKRVITIVRPGYKPRTIEVEPKAGAKVDVVVELEK